MTYRLKDDFVNELGNLKSWCEVDCGIELKYETEKVKLEIISEKVFKIHATMGGKYDKRPSAYVIGENGKTAEFAVEESGDSVFVSTSEIKVELLKNEFGVRAWRSDGSRIMESVPNAKGEASYRYLNTSWKLKLNRNPHDNLLGLGEKTGSVKKDGRNYQMWNTDILAPDEAGDTGNARDSKGPRNDPSSQEFDPYYISIPFHYQLSSEGAASAYFFDNPYRGYFDMEGRWDYEVEFNGGQLIMYVFAGPEIPEILEAYGSLVGRMEVPPMWALGYHQCRWKAYSENDVLKIADEYRKNDIPCDTLWLDIDYMDEFRIFTWNKEFFPDMKGLSDKVKEAGFRMITIVDPGVKWDPDYELCQKGLEENHFCKCSNGALFMGGVWPGKTVFPDFSRLETQEWWGALNAKHVEDNGLAGIWNDMNEPAVKDADFDDMRFDFEGENAEHSRYHNQYATLMAKGTVEGLKKAFPNSRTFVLSRGGDPAIQRYAANWLGDNFSRWEHLWQSIPMACGLGISGQPFVGADIGGFCEASSPELLARWMQYGALTPFCRNHNADMTDQYAYAMGEYIAGICRDALKMRYKLLPYIYTSFVQASQTGAPVQRPLVYNYQDDAMVYNLDDEYLFGSSLLVAPVYKKQQSSRLVYLPEGEWYEYKSDKSYSGRKSLSVETPLEKIPVFAKAGSIIPEYSEEIQSTMNYYPEEIELNIYIPDKDGKYISEFREDDGETFNYQKGEYLHTEFTLERNGKKINISSEERGNGFPEHRRKNCFLKFFGNTDEEIFFNNKPVSSGEKISRKFKTCKTIPER